MTIKKKPVNYRLEADIVASLEAASLMSGVDKTELLEMALQFYFNAKLKGKGAKGAKGKSKGK